LAAAAWKKPWSRLDQVLVPPAGWIKARRIQEGDAMPFDGSAVLARSPLAILLEADRKLTAERRAAAKLHPKFAPSAELVARRRAESVARRRAEARETVIVLDLLEKLFAGGEHWIQGAYEDYAGSYCLVGGLRQIRRFREPEDKAGVYLLRAIARTTGARRSLIDFNDGTNGSRRTYADIRFVIRRARELAERDAQEQA
jgi:hypothetical protein